MTDDAQLATVLGQSLVAANRVLRDGKPQAAIDMVDIVLAALPAEGLEVIELSALPIKIIALSRLGRSGEALVELARLERRVDSHGSPDDREACRLLRERIADLTPRAAAAAELITAGDPDGLVEMEAVANDAVAKQQHAIALGALVFLGKVYASVAQPGLARDRLLRAKALLDGSRPLDDARHAKALAEIERLLAELPSPS